MLWLSIVGAVLVLKPSKSENAWTSPLVFITLAAGPGDVDRLVWVGSVSRLSRYADELATMDKNKDGGMMMAATA
jgi:hypothetical protein